MSNGVTTLQGLARKIMALEKRCAEIEAVIREGTEVTVRHRSSIADELTRIYDLLVENQKALTELVNANKEKTNGQQ